jgi:hypothetical protein
MGRMAGAWFLAGTKDVSVLRNVQIGPVQWIPGALSLGVKWLRHKANHFLLEMDVVPLQWCNGERLKKHPCAESQFSCEVSNSAITPERTTDEGIVLSIKN